MKTKKIGLIAVLLSVGMLASCGPTPDSSEPPTPPSSEETPIHMYASIDEVFSVTKNKLAFTTRLTQGEFWSGNYDFPVSMDDVAIDFGADLVGGGYALYPVGTSTDKRVWEYHYYEGDEGVLSADSFDTYRGPQGDDDSFAALDLSKYSASMFFNETGSPLYVINSIESDPAYNADAEELLSGLDWFMKKLGMDGVANQLLIDTEGIADPEIGVQMYLMYKGALSDIFTGGTTEQGEYTIAKFEALKKAGTNVCQPVSDFAATGTVLEVSTNPTPSAELGTSITSWKAASSYRVVLVEDYFSALGNMEAYVDANNFIQRVERPVGAAASYRGYLIEGTSIYYFVANAAKVFQIKQLVFNAPSLAVAQAVLAAQTGRASFSADLFFPGSDVHSVVASYPNVALSYDVCEAYGVIGYGAYLSVSDFVMATTAGLETGEVLKLQEGFLSNGNLMVRSGWVIDQLNTVEIPQFTAAA